MCVYKCTNRPTTSNKTETGSNPEKTSILIKAAGDVTTGTVEMVRRGVAGSEMAAERKVYVGVKEEQ